MTAKPTYPRSTCCIQGCERWSRKFPGEWICARHWKMVPKAGRQVLRRAWARNRAAMERYDAEQVTPNWRAWRRAYSAAERLWAHAKRIVTFRAAGL